MNSKKMLRANTVGDGERSPNVTKNMFDIANINAEVDQINDEFFVFGGKAADDMNRHQIFDLLFYREMKEFFGRLRKQRADNDTINIAKMKFAQIEKYCKEYTEENSN